MIHQKVITRYALFFVLLFAISSAAFSGNAATNQDVLYNSFVTVKVSGLNNTQRSFIYESAGKSADVNIEYTCLESGVMVFRIQDSQLHEKPDLQKYIQNLVLEKAKVTLKFLDFHTERSEGNTKC